eukprot:478245-Pyramimonas_sp.AAC.1
MIRDNKTIKIITREDKTYQMTKCGQACEAAFDDSQEAINAATKEDYWISDLSRSTVTRFYALFPWCLFTPANT